MGNAPKIALFDIETAPNLSYVWGHYEQNVLDVRVPWYILCFAYKWLGESRVTTHALPDYRHYNRDKENDAGLCKDLWSVFDQADIVIGHNGDRFDIRKANARFIAHGLAPPSPFKSIDTLKIARRHFKFDSNKLNDLGKYLSVGRKLPHTGFHLWHGCMTGEAKSWRLMRRYNARDVELLEKVYVQLRPWASGHPNLNAYTEKKDCPACQSSDVIRRGYEVSKTRKYQRWHCKDCGHWFRGATVKQEKS
jgi:hypothetical protein